VIDTEPARETLSGRAAALFSAFRAGDQDRMADLVALLTPILWHTARAQRVDRETAEDVVQSAWLALARSADSIADPQAVLQWLLVAVRRESWRVVKRADRLEPTEIGEEDVTTPAHELPEARIVEEDQHARLWKHIGRLPTRCQALLRVIAFADKPDYATVAQALGMPVGSIGPTRGRCLAKLRAALASDPAWEA
jgi:RNA polymerase sigma factor (sigma-70 family)